MATRGPVAGHPAHRPRSSGATSLEDAPAKRAGERRLWGALTVVAVLLVLLGVAALAQGASSMIDLGQDASKPTAPKPASKPPPRSTRPAPHR